MYSDLLGGFWEAGGEFEKDGQVVSSHHAVAVLKGKHQIRIICSLTINSVLFHRFSTVIFSSLINIETFFVALYFIKGLVSIGFSF